MPLWALGDHNDYALVNSLITEYAPALRQSGTPFMSDLDMGAAVALLSRMPSNFITMMMKSMSLSDRFTCALVCKAWAEKAAAATHSIILRNRVQDLSCLQRWLEKHGRQVEILQLHDCRDSAVLTALPCLQVHYLLPRGRGAVLASIARCGVILQQLPSSHLSH